MPFEKGALAYLYGSATGVWAVDWITFWGVVLFNTLTITGVFERFRRWLVAQGTADVRVQTLLFAWAFGALLEGLVGFGYPWAVMAPILITLGIPDLDAVLALLPPWVLLYLVAGRRGLREGWPLAIVGSLGYIAGQYPVAVYLGPYLPDVSGAIVCFVALLILLKFWRPATVLGYGDEPLPADKLNKQEEHGLMRGEVLQAWMPFIVLIAVVVLWTGPWSPLPKVSWFAENVQAVSSVTHNNIVALFNFAPFIGGTAILTSWIIVALLLRTSGKNLKEIFRRTFHQMWGALLVGVFIFGLAYVFNFSGMAASLAYAFSKFGLAFILIAPVLGWIGVALSGSNTSTNAMFGAFQALVGKLLGLPALNSVGAEVVKPVAPQTASVGVSTSKFVRNEGVVIRHNMGWTLFLLGYLILIGVLFYFAFPKIMMVSNGVNG